MAGAGAKGIIHHDDRQRPDAVAFALEQVRLGDLFVQGAACQFDPQGVFLEERAF